MPGQCCLAGRSAACLNLADKPRSCCKVPHGGYPALSVLGMHRLAQLNKPAFGPYGGCQGQRFPYRQCQLKNQTDPTAGPLRIYEAGDLQPYVSGYLARGSTA